jgi:CRP-like cAMP-binding protein
LPAYIRKLERFCPLSSEEREAITRTLSGEQLFAQREDIIQEGEMAEFGFVVLDGFACRYKLLPDGGRQIVGFLLPGDMCDLRVMLPRQMDHAICAASPVKVALIQPGTLLETLERHPGLTRALWWASVVEDSIAREWMVNVGQRTALQRVAHLFCEVFWRLEAVGLAANRSCALPLTQVELGDALALSAVHVNRTLMYMRRSNLVELQGGRLQLLDRQKLEATAGFNPLYLHLHGANVDCSNQTRRRSA